MQSFDGGVTLRPRIYVKPSIFSIIELQFMKPTIPGNPSSLVSRHAPLVAVLCVSVLVTTACGTILYPERRGQTSGRIDPAVAVLDGVGLLFFIIPGVIAFAVDFADGAIYLPSTSAKADFDIDKAKEVDTGDEHLNAAKIRRVIKQHTGKSIALTSPRLRARAQPSGRWQHLEALIGAQRYAALTGSRRLAAR